MGRALSGYAAGFYALCVLGSGILSFGACHYRFNSSRDFSPRLAIQFKKICLDSGRILWARRYSQRDNAEPVGKSYLVAYIGSFFCE